VKAAGTTLLTRPTVAVMAGISLVATLADTALLRYTPEHIATVTSGPLAALGSLAFAVGLVLRVVAWWGAALIARRSGSTIWIFLTALLGWIQIIPVWCALRCPKGPGE
jgi:hypothetical protein